MVPGSEWHSSMLSHQLLSLINLRCPPTLHSATGHNPTHRPGAPGGVPVPPPRQIPPMKCGPLSALPQLQHQIAALGTEFDRMRAAMAAEVARIRADADADRADRADQREVAAAAAEAVAKREADLSQEMAEREERLAQIR